MNWLIEHLYKEAKGRRFNADDRIRYFTEKRKGKGNVVITPSFSKGTVVDFDKDQRRYKVRNDRDEMIDVHPRNLIPDSIMHSPVVSPEPQPMEVAEALPQNEMVTPFPR